VHLLQDTFVCMFYSAPRITGQCTFVSSTSRSLTFRWTAAKSATSYHLVGHLKSASAGTNRITVISLTAGSRYTFTVWAVGWQGLRSNNITCTDSTGLSEISFDFFLFTPTIQHCLICEPIVNLVSHKSTTRIPGPI